MVHPLIRSLVAAAVFASCATAATASSLSNASIGTNGASAPAASTIIGSKDGSGNTQPATTTTPIPVNVTQTNSVTNCAADVGPGTGGSCTQRVAIDSGTGLAGTVASGATDSGNPLKTGCVYNSTPPSLSTGQRGDTQCDPNSFLINRPVIASVADADGKSNTTNSPSGVATSGSIANPDMRTKPYLYNGSTWDRARGTTNGAYVQGPVATGSAVAGNPVLLGGRDGSGNAESIATDTNGNQQVIGNIGSGSSDSGAPVKVGGVYNSTPPTLSTGQRGDAQIDANGFQIGRPVIASRADADGLSNTSNAPSGEATNGGVANPDYRTKAYLFNGSTWDRQFTCSNTATVSITAGSTTQIVGLSGSTVIRICSFAVTMSAAGTFKFVQGTGSNCGTSTADITGAMNLAINAPLAMSSGNGSVFRTGAGSALCGVAVTGNGLGFVTYAQF